MSVITHRLNDGTDKALCGEKLSMIPFANVWHILLTAQDFNNDEITQGTRCADCADIQAAKDYAKADVKLTLNALYGKTQSTVPEVVHKADLVAAFNIVAERDKEITRLRQDILRLENVNKRVGEKLQTSERHLDNACEANSKMKTHLETVVSENVRLENELRYAKAENAPLARQNQRLAKNRDTLVDALNAIDNTVKDARETLKDVAK